MERDRRDLHPVGVVNGQGRLSLAEMYYLLKKLSRRIWLVPATRNYGSKIKYLC